MDEDITKSEEEAAEVAEEPKEEAAEVAEEPKEEATVVPAEDYSVGMPEEAAPAEETVKSDIEEPEEEEQPIKLPPGTSPRQELAILKILGKTQPKEQKLPQVPDALDYSKALNADPEVIEELEADRRAYGEKTYQLVVQETETREWKRDLKYTSPQVEKDFPFLDRNNKESFDPALADAINTEYLHFVGYDPGDPTRNIPESVRYPDVDYREFVESKVQLADLIASRKNAETVKNVARQAAQTGLRPDGSSAKRMNLNKDPKDMTMEELYAANGQTYDPKMSKL